jgi:hypothetical protein
MRCLREVWLASGMNTFGSFAEPDLSVLSGRAAGAADGVAPDPQKAWCLGDARHPDIRTPYKGGVRCLSGLRLASHWLDNSQTCLGLSGAVWRDRPPKYRNPITRDARPSSNPTLPAPHKTSGAVMCGGGIVPPQIPREILKTAWASRPSPTLPAVQLDGAGV